MMTCRIYGLFYCLVHKQWMNIIPRDNSERKKTASLPDLMRSVDDYEPTMLITREAQMNLFGKRWLDMGCSGNNIVKTRICCIIQAKEAWLLYLIIRVCFDKSEYSYRNIPEKAAITQEIKTRCYIMRSCSRHSVNCLLVRCCIGTAYEYIFVDT